METLRIGQFNARGPNNGIEHWFDLIREELIKRGHEVDVFWLRGRQPTINDIKKLDFNLYHFSQIALLYMGLGIPFCILPSANDCFPDKGMKLKIAASHPSCKFITYQSNYHLRKYKEWEIPIKKVYVPMPARVNLFKRNTSYNPSGKIVAGGRLVPKKGLDRLKGVKNLTIFGDGPLRHTLQWDSLEPGTEFTGHLQGDELKNLFEESSIYLFPAIVTSDGDSEGISNTIKEAMLMELQVICTPIAGNAEFENVSFLSDWSKINEVIEDTPKEPNVKGRAEILKNFTPKGCVNNLLDEIGRVI